MTEGPQPEESGDIEGILADLDVILTGAAGTPPPTKPPMSANPAASAPVQSLKIELPPRAGMIVPPKPAVPPAAPPPPGPAARPPLELHLGAPPPAAAPTGPQPVGTAEAEYATPRAPTGPQPVGTADKEHAPPRAPTGPQPVSAASPPVGPSLPALQEAAPPDEAPIPDNTPKDQVRRLAVLYPAGARSKFEDFVKFTNTVALHFTKKPLYLRKCLVLELAGGEDPKAVADRVKASGAVAVVGLFANAPTLRGLEEPLAQAQLFFRWIAVEEAAKKSAAIDLLVELTLLSCE